jgi:hypothetical protein
MAYSKKINPPIIAIFYYTFEFCKEKFELIEKIQPPLKYASLLIKSEFSILLI